MRRRGRHGKLLKGEEESESRVGYDSYPEEYPMSMCYNTFPANGKLFDGFTDVSLIEFSIFSLVKGASGVSTWDVAASFYPSQFVSVSLPMDANIEWHSV